MASSRWPSDGVEYGELSTWIQCRMRGSGFGARSIANSRALVYGIQEGLGFPFNTHGLCIYARPCASTLRHVFFHQCQQFRESPSLARDLGAQSGRRRGDQASGLGFGAHLNEDSRGMARAVSTRSLIATHLRSGFLRFERAHKTQRERGKSFEASSVIDAHSHSAALTF